MSPKKRNAPRSPAEVQADIERAPAQNAPRPTPKADEYHGPDARAEALALVQHARVIEANVSSLGGEATVVRRLLIALLETLPPEQRAEVRRRLGE